MPRTSVLRNILLTGAVALAGNAAASGHDLLGHIPAPVLLKAVPFELERPYASSWRAERPMVSRGWILVLGVDRALATPRAAPQPAMFAGGEVIEIVFRDPGAGIVAGIVRESQHPEPLPVWWGGPITDGPWTRSKIEREMLEAQDLGRIRVYGSTEFRRVLPSDEARSVFHDRGDLYAAARAEGISATRP